jgi:hypothetical protein
MNREVDELAVLLALSAGGDGWDPGPLKGLLLVQADLERELLDGEFAALESLLPYLAADAQPPTSQAAIVALGRALLATDWHRRPPGGERVSIPAGSASRGASLPRTPK